MKKKRWRVVNAKSGEIKVSYGKADAYDNPDLVYSYRGFDNIRATSNCVMFAFENVDIHEGKSLRKILEERGFDITTLKFSIQKKVVSDGTV